MAGEQVKERNLGMTPKDMVELVNTDPRSKTSFFSETVLKTSYPLYNLFVEYPTNGSKDLNRVTFPAYLKEAITDTYSPTYTDAGPVFGRMDPIPVYSKTTRAIKVAINIPANSIDDAREIRKKLDLVVKNTYPTYEAVGGRNIIRKPPLIRIKFGNIICNPLDEFRGLLGYLSAPIAITHDLSSGVFTEWPGQEIYSKKYSLSFSMNVLHEFTPGIIQREQTAQNTQTEDYSLIFPGKTISGVNQAQNSTKTQTQRIKDAEKKLFG